MKKTVNTIEVKNAIEVIAGLKARQRLPRKEYKAVYDGLDTLCKETLYPLYCAMDKGTKQGKELDKARSEAMTKTTAFLHTLGKANGKYISVADTVEEKQGTTLQSATLFDTLLYHSYKHDVICVDNDLAHLKAEKAKASKAQREAHTALLNGKGSAKDYKEKAQQVKDIEVKIEALRNGSKEIEKDVAKRNNGFSNFALLELKKVAKKRFAMSDEEVAKERKLHNKETKEKRKAGAKPEAKKPESKNGSKAKKPEAVSPEKRLEMVNALESKLTEVAKKQDKKQSPESVKKTA